MRSKTALLLPFLLCLAALPAQAAKPLIADLSRHVIEIDSRFAGTQLILFGAQYDIGQILVVVRGPSFTYTIRRKSRVMGIWVNTEQQQVSDIPSFISMAATAPLSTILSPSALRAISLGPVTPSLLRMAESNDSPDWNTLLTMPQAEATVTPFLEALSRNQWIQGLYLPQPEPITFMGETLFKTVIDFPKNIPRGMYTAEVYLISGGEIIAMQSTPINVYKTGFDAFIYDLAHQRPAIYGLMTILVALAAGWLAGVIFRR